MALNVTIQFPYMVRLMDASPCPRYLNLLDGEMYAEDFSVYLRENYPEFPFRKVLLLAPASPNPQREALA